MLVESPTRRSRRLMRSVLAVLVATALTSACTGQRDPTGYTAGVGKNFVAGCEKGFVPKGSKSDPKAKFHVKYCSCLYTHMSNKQSGIKFSEFADAQNKIRQGPAIESNAIDKLIPQFPRISSTCKAKLEPGPEAPSGASAN